MVLNLAEAKRFTILNENFNPTYALPLRFRYTIRSVFAPIPVANGPQASGSSYARVGSEIVDPLLKLKWQIRINWANYNNQYGSLHFNMYLVSANDIFFGSNAVLDYGQGTSTEPGWFIQPEANRVTMNGNNVRILKKWTRHITPPVQIIQTVSGATNLLLGTQDIVGKMTYRWKRKMTFEDSAPQSGPNFPSGTSLRGNQYYILYGWGTENAALTTAIAPLCFVDSYLYFKDP